jgi:hypothetical protein
MCQTEIPVNSASGIRIHFVLLLLEEQEQNTGTPL